MPQISIIIPVYNAEKYLCRCIDSIISQTYTDWELLLIDDGSSDKSGTICDEYATRDNRIRGFHKENGGVSSARNFGLDNIRGEYVMFVDADDWMTNNTLTLCATYFGKYEIIRFSMRYVKSITEENPHEFILAASDSKTDIQQKILSRNSILGVCGGGYKSELFSNPSVRFDPQLIMAEDWLVLCQLVDKCQSIIELPDVCYCYNIMNEDSCSNNPSVRKVEQCLVALEQINKSIKNPQLHSKSVVSAKSILFKALIKAMYCERGLRGLFKDFAHYKCKYTYPSNKAICKSDISAVGKCALIIGQLL